MKLSTDLQVCVELALAEAARRHHEFATVEHLLYALLHDTSAQEVLRRAGANVASLRERLEAFLDEDVPTMPNDLSMPARPTVGFSRVVQRAAHHVQSSGNDEVEPHNVLVAIFAEPDSHAAYLLNEAGATRIDVVRYVSHGISKIAGPAAPRALRPAFERGPEQPGDDEVPTSDDPLEAYTSNLNARAEAGDIDPLIGRQYEIDRLVHTLARRRKNNPLLVGDAGVGKTAIVEGLARKIVRGEVPPLLRDQTVYALEMGSILAGTRYRGDFEERFKAVIEALTEPGRNAILFIDEIHTLVGAGAVSGGSLDASNMIKPALQSGKLRCIGATTFAEYRTSIERDRALARRFQVIEVPEPSPEDALKILQGLKSQYESFHEVRYSQPALKAAVDLSMRYLSDRRLPDKAIDLVDEAGAARRLAGGKKVGVAHIQDVVSSAARVPIDKVSTDDREALRDLDSRLRTVVYGQDDAVSRVAKAVRLARAGLRAVERPIGSFLFAGPTGVGKTELAKQLASVLGIGFIRFDMSEYMERHTVSRLIGAPPGYVGFDQGGLLTDAVTKNPHAVLLLDEIEKAHPDVFNVLLQIMDHGSLTDNNGRKADFRHVILIMTSNVGAQDMARRKVGFSDEPAFGDNDAAYKRVFTPEFRNRLDAKVDFAPLPREVMSRIVDKMVRELEGQLAEKKVSIVLTDATRQYFANKGYDPAMGARPLRRLLQDELSEPLAEELLYGRLERGGTVEVEHGPDGLVFRYPEGPGEAPRAEAAEDEAEAELT